MRCRHPGSTRTPPHSGSPSRCTACPGASHLRPLHRSLSANCTPTLTASVRFHRSATEPCRLRGKACAQPSLVHILPARSILRAIHLLQGISHRPRQSPPRDRAPQGACAQPISPLGRRVSREARSVRLCAPTKRSASAQRALWVLSMAGFTRRCTGPLLSAAFQYLCKNSIRRPRQSTLHNGCTF